MYQVELHEGPANGHQLELPNLPFDLNRVTYVTGRSEIAKYLPVDELKTDEGRHIYEFQGYV
jgi:hypothetical protein